jgi:hypothetical protein
MKSITMTLAETAIYDGDDANAAHSLRHDLYGRAQALADREGTTVEVCTADGIVALVAEPDFVDD